MSTIELANFYLGFVDAGVDELLDLFCIAYFIEKNRIAGYEDDLIIPVHEFEESVPAHLVFYGVHDDLRYVVA